MRCVHISSMECTTTHSPQSCIIFPRPSVVKIHRQADKDRFHQFGIEMLGSYSAAQDAEVISVATALLEELGVEGVELRINSLGCPECRARYNKELKEFIGKNLEHLCPTCKERFEKNPLRVLDCKVESCQKIVANAPSVLDCLDEECTAHFQKVQDILTANGIAFTIDPKIVRGLDYYTRTVFEFVSDGLTVCGGGRYDKLVEEIAASPQVRLASLWGLKD